jgi:hypothetical protein
LQGVEVLVRRALDRKMIHYLSRTDRTPDVKASRETLTWRRQRLRNLQITQMSRVAF